MYKRVAVTKQGQKKVVSFGRDPIKQALPFTKACFSLARKVAQIGLRVAPFCIPIADVSQVVTATLSVEQDALKMYNNVNILTQFNRAWLEAMQDMTIPSRQTLQKREPGCLSLFTQFDHVWLLTGLNLEALVQGEVCFDYYLEWVRAGAKKDDEFKCKFKYFSDFLIKEIEQPSVPYVKDSKDPYDQFLLQYSVAFQKITEAGKQNRAELCRIVNGEFGIQKGAEILQKHDKIHRLCLALFPDKRSIASQPNWGNVYQDVVPISRWDQHLDELITLFEGIGHTADQWKVQTTEHLNTVFAQESYSKEDLKTVLQQVAKYRIRKARHLWHEKFKTKFVSNSFWGDWWVHRTYNEMHRDLANHLANLERQNNQGYILERKLAKAVVTQGGVAQAIRYYDNSVQEHTTEQTKWALSDVLYYKRLRWVTKAVYGATQLIMSLPSHQAGRAFMGKGLRPGGETLLAEALVTVPTAVKAYLSPTLVKNHMISAAVKWVIPRGISQLPYIGAMVDFGVSAVVHYGLFGGSIPAILVVQSILRLTDYAWNAVHQHAIPHGTEKLASKKFLLMLFVEKMGIQVVVTNKVATPVSIYLAREWDQSWIGQQVACRVTELGLGPRTAWNLWNSPDPTRVLRGMNPLLHPDRLCNANQCSDAQQQAVTAVFDRFTQAKKYLEASCYPSRSGSASGSGNPGDDGVA